MIFNWDWKYSKFDIQKKKKSFDLQYFMLA